MLSRTALVRMAPLSAAGVAVSAVPAIVAMLLVPALSAHVIDQVVAGHQPGLGLVALAAVLAGHAAAEAYGGLARVTATTTTAATLRHRLLRHVFGLGVPGINRYATGDLVARLTGNAVKAASAVPALVNAVVAATASLGGVVALALIDWRLAAAFLVAVVPALVLLRFLMAEVTSRYGDYLERLAAIAARLSDALAGRRTIRASGTVTREVARVLEPLPSLSRAGMATWEVQGAISWQIELVVTGCRVLVLAVAGLGLAQGRISPGDFLAVSLYLTLALGLLDQVDGLIQLADARANAERIGAVLAEPIQVQDGRRAGLPPGPGAVRFRRVSVRRDGHIILDDIDLDVPPGAALALVGRSGAGKTTLTLLVGRLLDPDTGYVSIDGVPIDAVDPAALRREVAYAFDRPTLLGATVREALAYGRPDASPAEVAHAARVAQAEDFLRRLPAGVHTPLADAPFSGGELQRLGLARAVVSGGRVLVLDDATSSLDTITEAKLAEAVTAGLAGRTRLVVAHRAVTAARADLVAWLDGGRVRRVATHTALWAGEPDYRAVFASATSSDGRAA